MGSTPSRNDTRRAAAKERPHKRLKLTSGASQNRRTSRSSSFPWSVPIVLMLLGTTWIAASSPRLASDTELPPLGGTTLNGESLVLPRDTRGHPSILVIGFSKAAAKIARPWLDGCWALAAKSSGASVSCYGIRMLEKVPQFFRGAMERGMRSGL